MKLYKIKRQPSRFFGKISEISEFYNSTWKCTGGMNKPHWNSSNQINCLVNFRLQKFLNSTILRQNKDTLKIFWGNSQKVLNSTILQEIRMGYESAFLKLYKINILPTTLQFYNILKLFIKFFVWMYLKNRFYFIWPNLYIFII